MNGPGSIQPSAGSLGRVPATSWQKYLFLTSIVWTMLGCEAVTAPKIQSAQSQQTLELVDRDSDATAKHLLLVTIDTLRADVLSQAAIATPTLDALTQKGWWFRRCYAASMLTNPSHVSIMSSLNPVQHGVYNNQSGIQDHYTTLAKTLKENGFQTAAVIGFPHLNPEVSNLGLGFDSFHRATRQELSDAEKVNLAVEKLKILSASDERFFMWLHLTGPHAPYEPIVKPVDPAPSVSLRAQTPIASAIQSAPEFQAEHPWFKKIFHQYQTVEEVRALYNAEVTQTDEALGTLLHSLDRFGLHDVLLAVTSDHGENFGEHALYFHHGGLYASSTHVPLILAGPILEPAVIDELVGHIDIAPTLLELLGIEIPAQFAGRNLAQEHPTSIVYSEHMLGYAIAARDPSATLIYHRQHSNQFPSYPFVAQRSEFLTAGLSEITTHAKTRNHQRLIQSIRQHLTQHPAASAKPAVGQDLQSLKDLGYITH